MINAVFVGDTPSKRNAYKEIPFIGTRSFKRLAAWIKLISPDYYIVYNSDSEAQLNLIKALYLKEFKVVALGKNASKTLLLHNIPHMQLPHPSGLNRAVNDQARLYTTLMRAYNYVRGGV